MSKKVKVYCGECHHFNKDENYAIFNYCRSAISRKFRVVPATFEKPAYRESYRIPPEELNKKNDCKGFKKKQEPKPVVVKKKTNWWQRLTGQRGLA